MITEVQEMPQKLSKVAGTQQIDREWLQLKKFLFHNLHRKSKQSGDSNVNPRLKQRVWQYMYTRGLSCRVSRTWPLSIQKLVFAHLKYLAF